MIKLNYFLNKKFSESEPACLRQAGERNDLDLSSEGGLSAGGAKPHLLNFIF